VTTVTAL